MKITFDPAKSEATIKKRGLSFDLVQGFDWARALYSVDERTDYGERREIALGLIDGVEHVVVFTRDANVLRIISLRRANRKERKRYAET